MGRSEPSNPERGAGFLRRVLTATLLIGGVGVLAASVYAGMPQGMGVLAGLLLSVANVRLLQEIFAHALAPETRRPLRVVVGLLIKLPLLIGGTWLALGPLHLPPVWFLGGFTLVLAVILLKVLGSLLMSSRGRAGSRRGLFLGFGIFLLIAGAALFAPRYAGRGEGSVRGLLFATPASAQEEAGKGSRGTHAEGVRSAEGSGEAHSAEGSGDAHSAEDIMAREAPAGQEPGGHGGESAGERAEKEEAEPPELPSAFHILHLLFPQAAWAKFLYEWQNPIYGMIIIVFLCVMAVSVYRRRAMIPGKFQNGVEYLVESFSNFILGILGPRGKEFIPFLGTLFLYIWFNNLQGLVPFFKSPTSVYNTTLALAICVFAYVQYTGITKLGILGYLHHMMGSPRDVIGWCMVPLMLPLHLIEEVAKPVSLSLRLFGNILGEDVLLGIFATLGIALLAFMKSPVGIPLHLPFIFLSLLMSTIQALVFTLLATIYFSQMMPHEEEHGGHGH